MSRVVHFEITADDPARAADFYRTAFGWELTTWGGPDEYWLASTGDGPGIDGAICARMHGQAVVTTIAVDRPLEEVLAQVRTSGGEVLGEIGLIPGVGRHCYARDTEGNVIGLLEPAVPA